MRFDYRKKKECRIGTGCRLIAAVLCCVFLLSSFPIALSAADGITGMSSGKSVSDVYLMSVSTGAAAGNSVLYFGIRYIDGNGSERTEYVFVHDSHGMNDGDRMLNDFNVLYGDAARRMDEVFGYSVSDVGAEQRELRPYSTDQFIFRTYYGLKSIVGVDVYMSQKAAGSSKNEWTCADLRIYRVNTVYGVDMAGYFSSEYFVDFDGTLIARLDVNGGADLSTSGQSGIVSIGSGTFDSFRLKTSFSGAESEYRSVDLNRELVLRMDVADVYGAGIESFVNEYRDGKASVADMMLSEALTVVMTYQDTFGGYHTVNLPFITSAVCWAFDYDKRIVNQPLNGVAQQGETLVFAGSFPEFGRLTGFTLVYGKSAEGEAGMEFHRDSILGTQDERRRERRNGLAKDQLSFTGFSIFDATDGRARASAELSGAILNGATEGTPLYAYRSSGVSGQTVDSESRKNIVNQFTSFEQGGSNSSTYLTARSAATYVFELVTDMNESAGSLDELSISIRYHSTDGTEKSSSPTLVSDLADSFYGYWAGKNGNAGYSLGVSAGGKLQFYVGYTDVDYFTDIELSMPASMKDEWQMKSLIIYKTDSLSLRRIEWLGTEKKGGDTVTDRTVYRDFDSGRIIQRYDKKVLIRPEENSVTIHFNGESGEGERSPERGGSINWEEIRRGMTYNEALQDLGFAKAAYTYDVKVLVGSNSNASETYGDCGSNNIFYFQLIFENGKSAYVQANRQLEADGFRAGKTERFSVAINRDYGDLRAVRIIPSDIDNHDIFDKLNIQNITVVQKSSAGLSRTWIVDNVGWVGINSRDQGEKSSTGTKLRSELEVATNCLVTTKGYSMNFLVALATGAYPANLPQMSGSLTATIYYYKNSSNTPFTEEIDVAEAIAAYAGKATVANEKSGVNIGLGGRYATMLDPSYMLRENHVDRFLFTLTDVKEIVGIAFHAASDVDTVWKINGVDIYQILTDGPLYLNANDEYQRDADVTRLCSDTSTDGYEMQVFRNPNTGEGTVQDQLVEFGKNSIDIDSDRMEVVIDREPVGDDDTLSLYVYTTSGTKAASAGDTEATITYQMRDQDKAYTVKTKLAPSKDGAMLYDLGIGVKGISTLYGVEITSQHTAYIDHAVIRRLRSGVVIDTYELDFGGKNAEYTVSAVPKANVGTENRQEVTLQFTSDTVSAELIPATLDLAVSISYISVNDPTDTICESPYIYLTDQNIRSIHGGSTVDLLFSEPYIREIKKINVLGIGALSATIDAVRVETSEVSAGGISKLTGEYGVATKIPVIRKRQSFDCSVGSVIAIEMDFTTGADSVSGPKNTGPDASFAVLDSTGTAKTITVTSLNDYVVSGSFRAGDKATVRILLKNVSAVESLTLKSEKGATWNLAAFSAAWSIGGSEHSLMRQIGKTLNDGTVCTVNFREISLQMNVLLKNEDGSTVLERNTSSGCGISAASGQSLEFRTVITGATAGSGYTMTCAKISGSGTYTAEEKNGILVLKPQSEDGTSVFTVTATADENPSVTTVVTITVSPIS